MNSSHIFLIWEYLNCSDMNELSEIRLGGLKGGENMNEEIQNREEELILEETIEEEPIEIPEGEKRVSSIPKDPRIRDLFEDWQDGDLILDPEFQRRYVWDNKKASLLIESVLLEVPIPVIYLAEEDDGKLTVIDGQQRLRSLFRFLNNEFKLSGLSVLSHLNGKHFRDLDKNLQRQIKKFPLRVIEIRKESHPDVKFEIFERLNVGAVKLNDQELRNCIYRGRYNDLIKELAEDKDFLFLLGLKEPHKRMYDRELVLHFLAFYNQTYLKYKPPMKQFLNKEMENNKNISDEKMKELRKVFKETVSLVKSVFGDKAFRRFISGDEKDPNGRWEIRKINVGLFEIIMFGFSRYNKNQIIPLSDVIREELLHMMTSDKEFIDSISGSGTTSTAKVTTRFKKWLDALEKIVGMPKTEPRTFSWKLKKQLYEQNPVCAICGNQITVMDDAAIDHIEHYWRGGKTIPSNARLVHRYCNLKRGGRNDD